jgi:hypothetical protein
MRRSVRALYRPAALEIDFNAGRADNAATRPKEYWDWLESALRVSMHSACQKHGDGNLQINQLHEGCSK